MEAGIQNGKQALHLRCNRALILPVQVLGHLEAF